jgi:hypothetical protein
MLVFISASVLLPGKPAQACDLCFGVPTDWRESFAAAQQAAEREERLILVHLSNHFIRSENILKSEEIPPTLRDFLSFEIVLFSVSQTQKDADWSPQVWPEQLPAWHLLTSDGKLKASTPATLEPGQLVAWISRQIPPPDRIRHALLARERFAPGKLWALERLAVAYESAGDYPQALRGYQACVMEGLRRDEPAAPRRRRAIMRRIVTLAEQQPQARKLLNTLRRDLTKQVISGQGNVNVLRDLLALEQADGRPDAGLAIYDALPDSDRRLRSYLRDRLIPELVAARRFDQALREVDPLLDFEAKARFAKRRKVSGDPIARYEPGTPDYTSRRGVAMVAGLLALERSDEARELAEMVRDFDDSAATKLALDVLLKSSQPAKD